MKWGFMGWSSLLFLLLRSRTHYKTNVAWSKFPPYVQLSGTTSGSELESTCASKKKKRMFKTWFFQRCENFRRFSHQGAQNFLEELVVYFHADQNQKMSSLLQKATEFCLKWENKSSCLWWMFPCGYDGTLKAILTHLLWECLNARALRFSS